MHEMREVSVEVELRYLRKLISRSVGGLEVLLKNNWRMCWGRTSLQKSIFARVTLSRYCLEPKSSVGALFGASYQLLGADTESLNRMGLYLKSKMVQSAHTGDV